MARTRFIAEAVVDGALDRWDPEATPVAWETPPGPALGAWVEVTVSEAGAREVDAPSAHPATAKAQMLSIAAELGLDPLFPQPVLDEVDAFFVGDPSAPPGTDDPGLTDLESHAFVTIDNEDSRDLDQALFIAREGEGHRVYYALADASYYVGPGSALFDEALRRSASFYFPGFMIPMLPRALSEGLVSLNPHVPRRALVFDMQVDGEGVCVRTRIYRARIRSRAKLSYDGVQAFLDDPGASPALGEEVAESLQLLREVGQRRIDEASNRDVVHHRRRSVEVGVEGVRSFVIFGGLRNDVERYNEQLSLLCNVEGARQLLEGNDRPEVQAIYRVHPAPPPDRVESFAKMARSLAELHGQADEPRFAWRRDAGQSLSAYLEQLPRDGDTARVSQAIQRQAILMNVRSTFSDQPSEHHGVGAEVYARFSSPMREIVGVFLHKELLEHLGAMPEDAHDDEALREAVIEAANRAKRVQRKITALSNRLAIDELFARDAERPEPERPMRRATVMGVTHAKLHLSLDEPPIDVKIYRRDLEIARGDKIRLGSDDVTWRAERGEPIARVGDAMRVRVSHRDERRDRWVLRPV